MTPDHVDTARLRLDRVVPADLDDQFALHRDERVWWHLPEGRHRTRERTAETLAAMYAGWAADGLGYWSARLRTPVGDLPAGEFVGVGGCSVRAGTTWWNLYYRFRPEAQGHALATELGRAAVASAHRAAPARPVLAFVLEHNTGSARTAERSGLRLIWRGRKPDGIRLVFADRAVSAALLVAALDRI